MKLHFTLTTWRHSFSPLGLLLGACLLTSSAFAADKESTGSKSKSSKKEFDSSFQCCQHRDECSGLSVDQCCRSDDVSGCCCPSGGKQVDDLDAIEKRLKSNSRNKKSSSSSSSKKKSSGEKSKKSSKSSSSKKKGAESLGEGLSGSLSGGAKGVEGN